MGDDLVEVRARPARRAAQQRPRSRLDRGPVAGGEPAPSERPLVPLRRPPVQLDGALQRLEGDRHPAELEGVAQQEQVAWRARRRGARWRAASRAGSGRRSRPPPRGSPPPCLRGAGRGPGRLANSAVGATSLLTTATLLPGASLAQVLGAVATTRSQAIEEVRAPVRDARGVERGRIPRDAHVARAPRRSSGRARSRRAPSSPCPRGAPPRRGSRRRSRRRCRRSRRRARCRAARVRTAPAAGARRTAPRRPRARLAAGLAQLPPSPTRSSGSSPSGTSSPCCRTTG